MCCIHPVSVSLLFLLLLLLYVGIYNEASVSLEVEEMEPELSVMRETIDSMRHAGVKVREGVSNRESEEKRKKVGNDYITMTKTWRKQLALTRIGSGGMMSV